MLRTGQKRRRTTGEINQEQEEARLKQQDIEKKLRQYEELKVANEHLRNEAEGHRNSTNILNDLASKKKIRVSSSGEVLIPGIDEIQEDELANPDN